MRLLRDALLGLLVMIGACSGGYVTGRTMHGKPALPSCAAPEVPE